MRQDQAIPTPQLTSTEMPGTAKPTSRQWLALALTFLLLGAAYALPLRLSPNPPSGIWQGAIAPEVLNLYAFTVLAGWGHFIYAWRGQWQGMTRLPAPARAGYWAAVVCCVVLLAAFRSLLGVGLFSALVWIWFIAHFVKAELVFARSASRPVEGFPVSWQPVVAFAWLSLTLFDVFGVQESRWLLFGGSLALASLFLLAGGWRHLAHGTSFLPVLALFFTGEAFVWGTYGPFMHPAFRIGVYVFHVAGASFYHYLGSYSFGCSRSTRDRWLHPASIVAINLIVIGVCAAVAWLPALRLLLPVVGVERFTVWVAAHLAASDLMPVWKRRALSAR